LVCLSEIVTSAVNFVIQNQADHVHQIGFVFALMHESWSTFPFLWMTMTGGTGIDERTRNLRMAFFCLAARNLQIPFYQISKRQNASDKKTIETEGSIR